VEHAYTTGTPGTAQNTVSYYTYKYGGEVITVTGKVVNGIFQIGNAWVNK